ncbi:MAG: hypothetical protein JXB19_06925 [Bacteroidales bacterium]|nr:hypothetical protein [Bacteroidales bacterium]
MKKRINQFIAIALIAGLTITFGCEKDNNDDTPQLPPAATFITDFSEFEDGIPIKKSSELVLTNFQQAAWAVWYTNSMLTVGLAVPVHAYNLAVDQTPVRADNNTWEWSNDFELGQNAYETILTAVVEDDMVNWEMKISKADGFQDFIWFTGTCNILATEGTWTLYETPADPHALLYIDWTADYEAEIFDVTYTIVYASNNYYESYINYGITDADPDYDAYYNVYDNSNEAEIFLYKVYYNTDTHTGKYQKYINDDLNYEGCWDGNFQDVACSSEQ